jgi:hypothetical protein
MTRRTKLSDDALFAIGLFVIAFVLRFVVARAIAGEPVWDGHYYDFGARRIAEGHGYSDDRIVDGRVEWHPWCHYPVGYSAFLALFYRVLGSESWVHHLANALTGAALVVVVFAIGIEALDSKRARLAGTLAAVHPGLVLYGALVMGELLSALTILLAFLVAVRVRGLRGVALGALVLGASALVRPQALLCAPFLAIVARPGERIRAIVLACAMPLLPIAPWTARNCRVMDGCALVSTNAGWNLAIGSFPRATGRFETLRASDGCREVTGQVQQDRCWLHYGLENIRAAPGRWLSLVPAKLANTFDHESFAVEYLREARPHAFPEERRVAWRTVLTAIHRVLVVLMPLAFIALVRRGKHARAQGALLAATAVAAGLAIAANPPTFWPIVVAACVLPLLPIPGRPSIPPALVLLVVLVATTALTHVLFFGDDRYHMVITPALCLFAAAMLRKPEIE